MSKRLLMINNHAYETGAKQVKAMLKVICESVPLRTIYAVEKDGVIQCVNEQYDNKADILAQVNAYAVKRYKVYYRL